ncbi:DpnD/PcfM family protein [Pelistega indica]|nr:DpnD/PcfM family protein [Pelistega indica]
MMTRFMVEVTEELVRIVSIEAEDEYEALTKVRQLYREEEIVLDWSDFLDAEFNILSDD